MGKKAKKQTKKGSNSQDDSLNTGTTISQLNDDCLRCILAYLPIKDRIRLQRVSKRWQTLMPWNGMTELTVDNKYFVLGEDFMPLLPPVLENVLHLCGNYITDIKVLFWYDESHENAIKYLKMLKNSCPNIVNLDLYNSNVNKPLIEFLIENFADLKSFRIGGDLAKECEKEITKFFSKAKNLREIQLELSGLRGTCLTALPLESLEKFMVIFSENMILGNLCKAFQSMNNLSVLGLMENVLLIKNFDKLLNELPNKSQLESLSVDLTSIPPRGRIMRMKNLRYLTNLQTLSLSGPEVVYDEALTIIGNTCTKLKNATLLDSHKLTDDGWKNFAKLASIEDLNIGKLDTISDKCFDYLQVSSLKTLVCCQIGLTNESLRALLKSAHHLSLLDVAQCPQVNRATLIKDASEQIENRPKYEFLILRLKIDDSIAKITNILSRLRLEETHTI